MTLSDWGGSSWPGVDVLSQFAHSHTRSLALDKNFDANRTATRSGTPNDAWYASGLRRPATTPTTSATRAFGFEQDTKRRKDGYELRGGVPARAWSDPLTTDITASNGSGWPAFGGGVSMGGAGLQNAPRQAGAGNLSFAQSLSGSQPATPLDLS